jgi:ubiquinone/menaquinone biosynthesis C-methylase UbiE
LKTEWDYTELASAYLRRPDYSEAAIDRLVTTTGASRGALVCDIGAGTGHLTKMLAARGLTVTAVEPNDAMRELGIGVTNVYSNVTWSIGTGESTGQKANSFDLATFGSSFNVTDRTLALKETARILKPNGWFACLWNHRDLQDPLQAEIEDLIKKKVPSYSYGSRREDQSEIIRASGLFGESVFFASQMLHRQSREDCVEAWRSHATLQRQAGDNFTAVIKEISTLLESRSLEVLTVPYITRVWVAQKLR